jgi:hypothetical protein
MARATKGANRAIGGVAAGLFAVFLSMAFAVSTASAEIDGPCSATVNGIDIATLDSGDTGDAIKVQKGGQVALNMSTLIGFESHEIQLDYFGQKLPGDTRNDNGDNSFSDFVDVDDYATAGVGLYKAYGVATLTNGETCTGAVLIDVDGNPLGTIAGGAAAGAVAVGTAGAAVGLAASLGSSAGGLGGLKDMVEEAFKEAEQKSEGTPDASTDSAREEAAATVDDFVTGGGNPFLPSIFGCLVSLVFVVLTLPIRLPFMAIAGGGGGNEPPAATTSTLRRLPRARWTPRITLLGIVCGLIAGVGLAVLLQQYSVAIATRMLLIQTLVLGVVVYGLILPTIGRTIAVMRVNGRIAEAERRLGR